MFRRRTLQQLASRRDQIGARSAFLGFDGFIDTIVDPIRLRRGPGDDFEPIATMTELGQRIIGAAGKSTNLELYPQLEKLGGNGPIMANALLAAGARVTYVGALGQEQVHPIFAAMAARARTFTLCDPARTTALELGDGKLMLGVMRSFDTITYDRIVAVMGAAALETELAAADLVGALNWTMIPHMTDILVGLVERVLPRLPARPDRLFFFDLADPEKRSTDDLRAALSTIARFQRFGRVTLGLNLKEAQQVAAALGCAAPGADESGLRRAAAAIRPALGVNVVVIHPRDSAACAADAGSWWIPGPYTATPRITTGAGDHFNAGFAAAQLLGLDAEGCLGVGVSTSGHYVRTGESPTLADVETFLANWR